MSLFNEHVTIKSQSMLPLLSGVLITFSMLSTPTFAASNDSTARQINGVVWQKEGAIHIDSLISDSVPDNESRLVFIRPFDTDALQTSVNISVANRFQVSLQPGNFTQVNTCAGQTSIGGVVTGVKSNDLTLNTQPFMLENQSVNFFYVDVDEQGMTTFRHIDADTARQMVEDKTYQSHQISRVQAPCPMPAQPSSVADAEPLLPAVVETTPVPKIDSLTLDILFDTDQAAIKPKYADEVLKVATFMMENPSAHVTIEGHTDNRGKDNYNMALSQKRADAVKTALIDTHGIDASRLSAVGFGETKPIASNETAEGRLENRRVVAVITH